MTFSIFILAAILVQSIHISGMNELPDENKYFKAFGDEKGKDTSQQLARFKRQGATDTTAATTVAGAITVAPPITEIPVTQPPPLPYVNVGSGTPGFACSPDLYKNYSRKCCYLPSLIDDLQSTRDCSKAVKNVQPIAITQFGSRRAFGKRSANYRFQFKQMVQPVRPATP
ncbi:hypothetical protein B566_EDAN010723, partial [Ephemera danica]